ncbi:hypothetical protein Bcep1808_2158 [Burkholderia vietnamiensis G4]|uniref:Prepilin-type N-terminal cleavage/methylation domain-containing protein n=1 Tax=Burkholderia vietnamiensis (strain G4 / LMG 22486) TaxID=269482 RepID=A4JFV7_BURVG|nr:hypothetical protein Bcep1808_2158 [Burkholderia vietnamiensis G4]
MLRKLSQGFTLIEMMVVIAIIGALAAIAIPAYNNYTTKAKFTEVVLSTAPTKTAVVGCVESGDCVSGSTITIAVGGNSGSNTGSAALTGSSVQAIQAFLTAQYTGTTATASQIASIAATDAGRVSPVGGGPAYAVVACTNPAGYAMLDSEYSPNLTTNICDATVQNWANGMGGGTTPAAAAAFYAAHNAVVQPVPLIQSAYTSLFGSSTSNNSGGVNFPCVGAAPCSPPTKYVLSAAADPTGTITATAQSSAGLNGETYVLIPSVSSGRVDWTVSGTCLTRAGGALC